MALLDTLKSGLTSGLKTVGNTVLGAVAPGAAAVKNTASTLLNSARSAASMAPTNDPNKLFSSTGGANSLKNDTTFTVPTGGGVQTVTKSPTPTFQQTNPVTPKGDIGVPQIGSNSVALKAVTTPNPLAPKPAIPTAPKVNTTVSGSNPFGNSNYTPTFSNPTPAPTSQGLEVPKTNYINATAPTAPASSPTDLSDLEKAILGTYQQSDAERQAQDALTRLAQQQADLSGAYRTGTNKIGEQPIVLDLLRGQQQALQKQYEGQVGALADQAKPLEVQLANLVANRELQNKALSTQYGFETEKQKAAREAAAKDEGFTLGEGQMRYDSKGNLIATGGEKTASTPASIQEYQFAKDQGFNGSYLDYIKAKDQATSSTSSTPASYKEWQLAGGQGTYADWLTKSSGKAPTAAQYAAAGFANRVGDTSATFDQLGQQFSSPTAFGGVLPNILKSADRQVFEQAERNFINATLRRESGAAIGADEFANARQQYIPQPGDSAAVLAAKKQNRLRIQQQLQAEGAGALDNINSTQASQGSQITPESLMQKGVSQEVINAYLSAGKSLDDIARIAGFNPAPSKALNGSQIGSLSAKYESGGNPGAIGYDSTGGYSYGTYQLAHNNAQNFVQQSPYANQFAGIPFNSPQFQQKWKEIAAKDPQGFASAQHDYIAKTHLEPVINRLKQEGIDVSRMSPTVQDVIWSTAVQHGPNNKIIEQALASAQDEQDFIKKVYQLRWNNGAGFASSTPAVKQSVYNRFFGPNGELAQALARSQA